MTTPRQYSDSIKFCYLSIISFLVFLIVAIFALVFTSCGSSKNLHNAQTVTQENIAQQRKDTTSTNTKVHETVNEETNTVSEVHTIVYDTKLPVDTATGRAPVLSDTYTKTITGTKKSNQKDSNTQKQQSTAVQAMAEKKTDYKSVNQSERKETTIPRQLGFLAIGMAILAGTVCVIWLIYKKRNK